MNEELQYLREQLNQRLNFFYEHSQKTINMVLFAWGGILVILGATESFKVVSENIFSQFVIGTIFLISNLMLYFSTKKGCDNVNCVSRIEAYIKKIRSDETITGDNDFCWEKVNLEIWAKDNERSHIFTINSRYATVLMIISTLGLAIFISILVINMCGNCEIIKKMAMPFVTCAIYFIISLWLIFDIFKYTSLKYIDQINKQNNDTLELSELCRKRN